VSGRSVIAPYRADAVMSGRSVIAPYRADAAAPPR